MWLFEKAFTIITPVTCEEARTRIAAGVTPHPTLRFPFLGASTPFLGSIQKNAFVITRAIRYKNSFKAFLHGTLSEERRGTFLTVQCRPHRLVEVMIALVLTVMGLGLVSTIGGCSVILLFAKDPSAEMVYAAFPGCFFVMVTPILLAASLMFHRDVNKSKQRLLHYLGPDAREVHSSEYF